MGGATGMLVDTFQRQKQHEYERILELCHLHGVPLSKNLLQKGIRRMGYITYFDCCYSWVSLYHYALNLSGSQPRLY